VVGNLADSILKDAEVKPTENCRSVGVCPKCTSNCADEAEIDQTKEAAKKGHTTLPSVDDSCSEPLPAVVSKGCEDSYPENCKKGEGSCYDTVYKRMMRMECVFTCICSWLPWGLGK
jgi:hypothetical protein